MPLISAFCKKGGVGKTTFISYLAHYLANQDKKVLLISADDQNSVFTIFGKGNLVSDTQDDYFDNLISGQKEPNDVVFDVRDNLFLMKTMNSDKISIQLTMTRPLEKRLRGLLEEFKNYFDFIFVDFPPSSSRLTEILLDLSDQIFVVCSLDALGIDGYKNTVQYFVDSDIDLDKITHVVPVGYHPIKKAPNECLQLLKEEAKSYTPNAVISTPINDKSVVRNLQADGISLFDGKKIADKFHEKNRVEAKENFEEVFKSLGL